MEFKKVAVAIALSAGLASVGLQAAQDGELGTDSTGSTGNFDINLYNNAQSRVFGLQDINLDSGESTESYNFCVYSNTDFARFEVSSASGDFSLTSGGGSALPYTLALDEISGSSPATWGESNLGSGEVSTKNFPATGSGVVDNNTVCSAFGENVTVTVNVDTSTVADPGAYSDRVTLTVTAI
ncbi:hypothetical protein [Endozoicomonas sp. ISHI1]|uniref:hypothetical protein n=1 Tax=Endozoicomonas sp. ISHI1 TaxID=2825882 RepID=UPI002147D848|nr:hypothetical protein [Endozoicomonas sp. ISHI1]